MIGLSGRAIPTIEASEIQHFQAAPAAAAHTPVVASARRAAWPPSQPAASSATVAGGTRLRRRLSKILKRAIGGSTLRDGPGAGRPGQQPGAICQSPRTQRCWRRREGGVARRVAVEQLHVGEQPGPRVAPFDQIVAEQGILGEAIRQRRPQHGGS